MGHTFNDSKQISEFKVSPKGDTAIKGNKVRLWLQKEKPRIKSSTELLGLDIYIL